MSRTDLELAIELKMILARCWGHRHATMPGCASFFFNAGSGNQIWTLVLLRQWQINCSLGELLQEAGGEGNDGSP